MLRRLWGYAQKRLGVATACDRVCEYRRRPRIPAAQVVRALVVMALTRVGSLHAMRSVTGRAARRWSPLAVTLSDDTLSRGLDGVGPAPVRRMLLNAFERLVRMKALRPQQGIWTLIVDGHESHASFDHCCPACLQRRVTTKNGARSEYYHRHVTARVPAEPYCVAWDIEPLRPGEDEVAAARRLMTRLTRRFPRLFRLVLADALYARADFVTFLRAQKLHAMIVFKQEERTLMREARRLRTMTTPEHFDHHGTACTVWDIPDCSGWDSCPVPVRIIISEERRGTDCSTWIWITTLPQEQYPACRLVPAGHGRWCIENQGFNELANHWHADHVYRHTPRAIVAGILLTMFACLVFHQFYFYNLHHRVRGCLTKQHVARQLQAELYHTPGPDTS